jgi:hypothetical protein
VKTQKISWTQVETGSAVTWKYPSVILKDNSVGEFYSIAVTNNFQQADTGTKMIHLGKKLNRPLKTHKDNGGFLYQNLACSFQLFILGVYGIATVTRKLSGVVLCEFDFPKWIILFQYRLVESY